MYDDEGISRDYFDGSLNLWFVIFMISWKLNEIIIPIFYFFFVEAKINFLGIHLKLDLAVSRMSRWNAKLSWIISIFSLLELQNTHPIFFGILLTVKIKLLKLKCSCWLLDEITFNVTWNRSEWNFFCCFCQLLPPSLLLLLCSCHYLRLDVLTHKHDKWLLKPFFSSNFHHNDI